MSFQSQTLPIIILTITLRIFIVLTISILRESPEFIVHLAYSILIDTSLSLIILILILHIIPWARRLRIQTTRVVNLTAQDADSVDPLVI